jgi:hypothetical protein
VQIFSRAEDRAPILALAFEVRTAEGVVQRLEDDRLESGVRVAQKYLAKIAEAVLDVHVAMWDAFSHNTAPEEVEAME